ncbi:MULTISPECIES: SDR family oxidoreductase [unclassified Modestobacter]|uniref:SDR family oxidoreductase n=1 Tax=unclassified Modestobacter TaxID=2643866 RepID=UPI0022AA57B3|nr:MULTISPECIES: SDR family oxidoreductase [unclassified Modestobacter]MCZ2826930.1 SDR family oxidoreductase [Modestobacter sp. VKM Ac-2981]MCZ2855374.1 SDR family oxidoreductase [Modestobacter sp. VKM Ac-2982]
MSGQPLRPSWRPGLSKSAALEYVGDGIRVNVVAPGVIETPMTDRVTGGTSEGR